MDSHLAKRWMDEIRLGMNQSLYTYQRAPDGCNGGQIRGNGAVDNTEHLAHDGGLTGKQKAQREWNAKQTTGAWAGPQQIGAMYWTPLCGNSIDLECARKNGDLRLLEEVIGIGYQIIISAKDRACENVQDCTAVLTHWGGCDCGTPVSVVAAGKYKQQLQNFCAIARLMEHCEIVYETFVPACHEGLCQ